MFRNFFRYGKRYINQSTRAIDDISRRRLLTTGATLVAGYGGYAIFNRKRKKSTKSKSSRIHKIERNARSHVQTTFSYLSRGLLVTSAAALAGYSMHSRYSIARHPFLYLGGSLALLGGTLLTDHVEKPFLKSAFYYGYCTLTGLTLSIYRPEILIRAACYTSAVVAGVGLSAYYTKDFKSIEQMIQAPLFTGLNVILASSILSLVFHNSRTPIFRNLSTGAQYLCTYGGLALFTGFLYYDMNVLYDKYLNLEQRVYILERNGTKKYHSMDEYEVDHISDALSVYLDVINILIRIASILEDDR